MTATQFFDMFLKIVLSIHEYNQKGCSWLSSALKKASKSKKPSKKHTLKFKIKIT